jgi:hypothetical protein
MHLRAYVLMRVPSSASSLPSTVEGPRNLTVTVAIFWFGCSGELISQCLCLLAITTCLAASWSNWLVSSPFDLLVIGSTL